jgi:putative transcriptional regulator
MIKCHLSRILGEKRLKIAEVSRETGINRGTLTRIYNETAERIELDAINELCKFLECQPGDLFEYVHVPGEKSKKERLAEAQ